MKLRVLKIALASLALCGSSAWASAYPNKPVRVIIPFPPGGTTDIVGRVIANELSKTLGQPFVVENKPGAGGNIGADFVANSEPDGYTLMVSPSNILLINPIIYSSVKFDPVKSFTPIGNFVKVQNIIMSKGGVSRPLKDFADLTKPAQDGQATTLTYGTAGNGSMPHLIGTVLTKELAVPMTHVPYKGSTPMIQDLIGGQLDIGLDNLPPSVPHIKSGRLTAIAIIGDERSALLPDVPTIVELGYPNLNLTSFFGLIGPKGMSDDIAEKINAGINTALASSEIQDKLINLGTQPAPMGQKDFSKFIEDQVALWKPVVVASGAKVD